MALHFWHITKEGGEVVDSEEEEFGVFGGFQGKAGGGVVDGGGVSRGEGATEEGELAFDEMDPGAVEFGEGDGELLVGGENAEVDLGILAHGE